MSSIHKPNDALRIHINQAATESKKALDTFKNSSLQKRNELLQRIATLLKDNESSLIETAAKETHLSPARLKTELDRTLFQLKSYGVHCEGGQWLDARIDTPAPERPNKRDVRKTMVPLGPVVVFGASNFPFAYSTPGGDTASALAAGCTVIVKAHPAHPETSTRCAEIISKAVADCGLPPGIFTHIADSSYAAGEYLVKHPLVKAVSFTGSFSGGKQIFDWANQREEPIPVYAEMGSTNPVFILPERLEKESEKLADEIFSSITLSMGQFCTKPGLIVGMESAGFPKLIKLLSDRMDACRAEPMLHQGILENFNRNKSVILGNKKVETLSSSKSPIPEGSGIPTLAHISANEFMKNREIQREVFGPFALVITCRTPEEVQQMASLPEGQLTATLIGSAEELKNNKVLLDTLKMRAGRIILNGVPTGVEVCLSMHHGGPFPASSDSRFSSVGADAIKRFARPVSLQNWPDDLLPDELKNDNPLKIWRTLNNMLTKDPVTGR